MEFFLLWNVIHITATAKTKTFVKAAENLYMGQPNLSRAIKELEQSLNIKIFNKNTIFTFLVCEITIIFFGATQYPINLNQF